MAQPKIIIKAEVKKKKKPKCRSLITNLQSSEQERRNYIETRRENEIGR